MFTTTFLQQVFIKQIFLRALFLQTESWPRIGEESILVGTLSPNRLNYILILKKKDFRRFKEYFQKSNLFKMIQRIVQKVKTKKIGKHSIISNDRTTTITT